MNVTIRQERADDFTAVFAVVEHSFKDETHSDQREQFLVERLRHSESFVPELSLVAETADEIAGYILLTRIRILNNQQETTSLALAPLAVAPQFQRKGIGGKLILEAHGRAKQLGFQSIIVVGHENYYPRFGYQPADKFGITFPFDVPKVNGMAIELNEGTLRYASGVVEYPKEFYE